METLVLTLHYIVCFILIVMILLQAGKGADIGAVFGGASQTMFGSRGPATFLNKLTIGVAIGFLVTSILLAHIAKSNTAKSVIDKTPAAEQTLPAAPEAAPAEQPQTPEAPAPAPAK